MSTTLNTYLTRIELDTLTQAAREAADRERDTLARVLNAVPVAVHNAAVRASGVGLIEYTHAMEHGLHIEPDVPLPARGMPHAD